jgi:hypothetical protein
VVFLQSFFCENSGFFYKPVHVLHDDVVDELPDDAPLVDGGFLQLADRPQDALTAGEAAGIQGSFDALKFMS